MRKVGGPATRLFCVVLLLAFVGGVTGCGTATDPSVAQGSDATPIATEYFASEFGVRVGVRVGFAEDRVVTGARLVWEGGSDEVGLYPLDGTDPEPPPETLDLPRGVQVSLEGTVLTACPEVPSLPVFEVQTVRAGQKVTERYVPDQRARFEDAFAKWCALPFTVSSARSRATPEGDYTCWLRLTNPGPSTVTVVSERVTGADWVWESSRAVVPAGTLGELIIRGHGAPPRPPWESGHLLADDRPIRPIGPGEGLSVATMRSPSNPC